MHNDIFRTHFINTVNSTILTTLLRIVRDSASQVSEPCLAHCLKAIAALTKKNSKGLSIMMRAEYAGVVQMVS